MIIKELNMPAVPQSLASALECLLLRFWLVVIEMLVEVGAPILGADDLAGWPV